MELRLPLKHIMVTQPFGMNYVDFYKKLGLDGHNGTDFEAKTGCPIHASHRGYATFVGKYSDGCLAIELTNKIDNIKTMYYHLDHFNCKQGDFIEPGQIIGYCDNTGLYTTGDHLHWGFKFIDSQGNTINYDNGFKGAIDPMKYVTMTYDGTKIKNSDAGKCNAYHRYYRKDRNYGIEVKKALELTRILKRLPKPEEINAVVYGAWDREAIQNPAMYNLWGFITKNDYLKGIRPFA